MGCEVVLEFNATAAASALAAVTLPDKQAQRLQLGE